MQRKSFTTMLGRRIKIDYIKNLHSDESEGLFGDFDSRDLRIRVDADLEGRELEATILHELIHGALYLTGHSFRLSDEEEEALVRGLEHALIDVVKLR